MSELIERVARKIDPWAWQEVGDGKMSNIPAAVFQRAVSLKRAPDAIAAVAEWMIDEFSYQAEMIEIKRAMVAALRAAAGDGK